MRLLRRAGLLSTLLIGGVLGGLTAPLPSEAVGPPTLTLQIDGQPLVKSTGETVQNNSILGPSVACSAADVGLGYTACYSVLTSTTVAYKTAITQTNPTTRLYRIQNATGATARLRVGDNLGQDNFSLVGVQFVPVSSANQPVATVTNWTAPDANTNEQHVLKITMKHKFDSAVNQNNATGVVVGSTTVGQVAFGMASGGEFRSAPLSTPVATTTLYCITGTTKARCNTVGDNVVLTGTGIFSGTTAVPILSPTAPNNTPLSLTVPTGNANDSIVGYPGLTNATMGQVNPTYPKFDCKDVNASTKCQPDITLTLTATLKGPDTFVMLNGGADGFCAICNFAQDNTRLTRLFTFLTNVIAFLDWWENNHADNPPLRAIIEKGKVFLAGFIGPPADPACPGSKYVETQLTYEGGKSVITIAGDGGVEVVPAPPAPETGTITINKFIPGCAEVACSPQTFNFLFQCGDAPCINPADDQVTTNVDGSGSGQPRPVNAGTWSVTEEPKVGWHLDNSTCPLSVVVPAGGNVTCTFTNSPVVTGRIVIIKNTFWTCPSCPLVQPYPNGTFNFRIFHPGDEIPFATPQIDITDGTGTKTTSETVEAGDYFVDEFDQGFPWTQETIVCGDGGLIHVTAGSTVTCTFNNSFFNLSS